MSAESSGGHLLEVDRIGKRFGSVIALRDISAHLDAGEVQ
jgi:ABC-type sugar transport system ATPase subunit